MLKLPEAGITHTISGRLRLKIPSKKGNNSYFGSLEQKLSGCDGVQGVKANAVTASVLLLHNVDINSIAKFAEENRLFKVQSLGSERTLLVNRIRNSFEDLNRRTKNLTGGELDIASAVFVSLVSISIYQIARGNFFAPAWYTSLWYAVNMVFRAR
ncbi:MAG: hypothetical protein U9Q89_08640 [Thermodesulfobacteriota bacterium]|nr:hypothetical protein [Thermodesulfobacteriota bacterium]